MNPLAVEPTNIATREARCRTFRNSIPIDIYSIRQLDSDEDIQRTYFRSNIGLGFQLELNLIMSRDALN